jgi:hypothetical protein
MGISLPESNSASGSEPWIGAHDELTLYTVEGSIDIKLYASWVTPTLVRAAFSPPNGTIRTEA